MAALTPMESEFATTEEAEAYDRWFRAKVKSAMADGGAKLPHDEAMAKVRELITRVRDLIKSKRRAAASLGH